MSSTLTKKDYVSILQFYKQKIPRTMRNLKKKAELFMSTNLCKCIKKLEKQKNPRAIGICTKAVVNNKGFTRGKFKCRYRKNITLRKNKTLRK